MKGQTCKWGRLWHKCSPRWGRGRVRPRWQRGQWDSGAAQVRVLLKVPDSALSECDFILRSVRELWNSLPCLLPAPSASIFRLSFPFYTLSPHCQVPSIPKSPMDERCSQHPSFAVQNSTDPQSDPHWLLLSWKSSHERGNVHRTLSTSLPPFTQVIPLGLHIFKDLN